MFIFVWGYCQRHTGSVTTAIQTTYKLHSAHIRAKFYRHCSSVYEDISMRISRHSKFEICFGDIHVILYRMIFWASTMAAHIFWHIGRVSGGFFYIFAIINLKIHTINWSEFSGRDKECVEIHASRPVSIVEKLTLSEQY